MIVDQSLVNVFFHLFASIKVKDDDTDNKVKILNVIVHIKALLGMTPFEREPNLEQKEHTNIAIKNIHDNNNQIRQEENTGKSEKLKQFWNNSLEFRKQSDKFQIEGWENILKDPKTNIGEVQRVIDMFVEEIISVIC